MSRALTSSRRRAVDRAVAAVIHAVGLGIVALVLLILWYLLKVTAPLATPFRVGELETWTAPEMPEVLLPATANSIGHWVLPEAASADVWTVNRRGEYRCDVRASFRPPPVRVAAPPRAVALAERDSVLLMIGADGTLHRFGAAVSRCELQSLDTPWQQPFAADAMLVERDRPLAFLFGSAEGRLRVVLSTTGEALFDGLVPGGGPLNAVGLASDGGALFAFGDGPPRRWALSAPFAEASWRSLWQPVWYGGYDSSQHVWHPASSSGTSLPRFGLSPLLWGTFKAALYGMLIAVPIALGAAIYTGFFLPQRTRNRVKPAIELMEAVPTVVLGFVAGIWLAPLLSDYLLAVFLLPLLLLGLPLVAALTHRAAQLVWPRFRRRPPRVAVLLGGYTLGVALLFLWLPGWMPELVGESARDALMRVLGVQYEQRNALLVGLVMGFALVPTLFSIIEDAIFAVPRSLSDASLALGATRWQSLVGVVLPAASPAILSALLIGLARGLGETMIVLLATGNTPIIEANAFSGLRSLAATLAAELPEVAVNEAQFRVLFLAALVLFALTFVLNTIAELFRQRLRYRYAGR